MKIIETSPHRMLEGNSGTVPKMENVTVAPWRELDAVSKVPTTYQEAFVRSVGLIATSLKRFEAVFDQQFRSDDDHLHLMLRHVSGLGGKRLRPCLLMLSAQAFGEITEETIRLAMVVELVHTATLVHDDILDDATLRRHLTTLHCKWNVPSSILVGDWLFTHAYRLANEGESTIPGRWVADAAKRVCEGEISQGNSVGNFRLSESEYLDNLEAKTGALCGVSCALGGWSTGANAECTNHLYQFGAKLGIAFQLFDDWLDLWGDTRVTGKTLGTDLDHLKPTLPMLHALSEMSEIERDSLLQLFETDSARAKSKLRDAMEKAGSGGVTLSTARRYAEMACEELSLLPEGPEKNALRSLAYAAVSRTC